MVAMESKSLHCNFKENNHVLYANEIAYPIASKQAETVSIQHKQFKANLFENNNKIVYFFKSCRNIQILFVFISSNF